MNSPHPPVDCCIAISPNGAQTSGTMASQPSFRGLPTVLLAPFLRSATGATNGSHRIRRSQNHTSFAPVATWIPPAQLQLRSGPCPLWNPEFFLLKVTPRSSKVGLRRPFWTTNGRRRSVAEPGRRSTGGASDRIVRGARPAPFVAGDGEVQIHPAWHLHPACFSPIAAVDFPTVRSKLWLA